MAWIFSLSAECGAQQAVAEQFSHHFDQVSWVLSNGSQFQCRVGIFQDLEENWWCRVYPSCVSEVSIDTPESAYLMTELGILLYQRLQSAPTFRYALVGVEVDELRAYTELLESSSNLAFPGALQLRSSTLETSDLQMGDYALDTIGRLAQSELQQSG